LADEPLHKVSPWREGQAGFAGTLISLAPALTLGLLAFAALGPQAAVLGIPAGLVCTAVGGAVFALMGRGPMPAGGPSTSTSSVVGALVAGVVADPAYGAGDPAALALLLALVAVAVVSMGVWQIVLAVLGLVRWAKFVPQAVLAGFMNGVALLAVLAQLPLLLGLPRGALQAGGWQALAQFQPAALAVGLFTMACIIALPRLNRRLPATLLGLLAGTAACALLQALAPQAALGPLAGALPAAWPHPDRLAPFFSNVAAPLLQRHVGAAIAAGWLMALLGTLDLALSSLALDQACHSRTDLRRELLALGSANVASGLVGGLPLLLLRSRALPMLQLGGHPRAAPLMCCAFFAVLGLVAMPLLSRLPQVVLGGVMVTIAMALADRWSLQLAARWWRGPRMAEQQLTLAVVAVVCASTVVLGFPAGVAIGALLSALLFARSMNRSLVRGRCTAEAMPSRRLYAAADEARLQTLRSRITVLELEGALFFGSADRVAELADNLPADCQALVLDLRRISVIDDSGAVVLSQVGRRLHRRGITLLLAGVSADNRHGRVLRQFAGEHYAAEHGRADTDQAVEAAELRLLAQAGFEPLRVTVPLAAVSLMQGLDATQRARLTACLQHRRLAAGESLFRHGDPGDRLYVITSGSINVFGPAAPETGALRQRYASLSPGMMLGETAMLDGGGRSGEAVADGTTDVHALDDATLQRLLHEDPLLHAQVHRNIALHLAQRLRAAARAWRASLG
jgi:MFS superfamily sulfate permease-like transporter/CRP-like cAMP-binding protein